MSILTQCKNMRILSWLKIISRILSKINNRKIKIPHNYKPHKILKFNKKVFTSKVENFLIYKAIFQFQIHKIIYYKIWTLIH